MGFSNSMHKEDIEVVYALLIVRILIFSILTCNVWELEQCLIKGLPPRKRSLKTAGLLVGALSVCKWFRLFRTASHSCLKLLWGLTIKLENSKIHWPELYHRLSDFPLGMEADQSVSHSREQSSMSIQNTTFPQINVGFVFFFLNSREHKHLALGKSHEKTYCQIYMYLQFIHCFIHLATMSYRPRFSSTVWLLCAFLST